MLRGILYHRVSADARASCQLAPNLVTVDPAALERQIRHVVHSYYPVSADELLAAVDGQHELPRGAVALTFDDGYRDFQDVAWPVLKKYHAPAILFVPTAHVGGSAGPFWWDALWQILSTTAQHSVRLPDGQRVALSDRAHQLKAWAIFDVHLKRLSPSARRAVVGGLGDQLGVEPQAGSNHLNWSELRQLARDGVAIAAHSQTHELLDQIDDRALQTEIAGSRDDLIRELGTAPPIFAYPNGNANDRVVRAVKAAGFHAAFSVRRGASRLARENPFMLRRDHGALGPARLAFALLGPVAAFRTRVTPLA
jgi:peptidoglycan/xylan/chitin deacetylase (PgdA/CDA1 family)